MLLGQFTQSIHNPIANGWPFGRSHRTQRCLPRALSGPLSDDRIDRVSQRDIPRGRGQRRTHLARDVRIADAGLWIGETRRAVQRLRPKLQSPAHRSRTRCRPERLHAQCLRLRQTARQANRRLARLTAQTPPPPRAIRRGPGHPPRAAGSCAGRWAAKLALCQGWFCRSMRRRQTSTTGAPRRRLQRAG